MSLRLDSEDRSVAEDEDTHVPVDDRSVYSHEEGGTEQSDLRASSMEVHEKGSGRNAANDFDQQEPILAETS